MRWEVKLGWREVYELTDLPMGGADTEARSCVSELLRPLNLRLLLRGLSRELDEAVQDAIRGNYSNRARDIRFYFASTELRFADLALSLSDSWPNDEIQEFEAIESRDERLYRLKVREILVDCGFERVLRALKEVISVETLDLQVLGTDEERKRGVLESINLAHSYFVGGR